MTCELGPLFEPHPRLGQRLSLTLACHSSPPEVRSPLTVGENERPIEVETGSRRRTRQVIDVVAGGLLAIGYLIVLERPDLLGTGLSAAVFPAIAVGAVIWVTWRERHSEAELERLAVDRPMRLRSFWHEASLEGTGVVITRPYPRFIPWAAIHAADAGSSLRRALILHVRRNDGSDAPLEIVRVAVSPGAVYAALGRVAGKGIPVERIPAPSSWQLVNGVVLMLCVGLVATDRTVSSTVLASMSATLGVVQLAGWAWSRLRARRRQTPWPPTTGSAQDFVRLSDPLHSPGTVA